MGRPRIYGPVYRKSYAGKSASQLVVRKKRGKYRKHAGGRKITLGGRGEMASSFTPFPPTQFCKMEFSDLKGLTSAATTSVTGLEFAYRLNSIWEPKLGAGATFRANGWDQISSIYQQYKVHGVKIEIEFTNPSADGMMWVIALRAPSNTANTNSLLTRQIDMRAMHYTGPINNTGSQVKRWSKYVNIGQVSGLTKLQFKADTEDYNSPIFTNPSKVPVLAVNVANSADATIQNLNFKLRLLYYVQLYDKFEIPNSVII